MKTNYIPALIMLAAGLVNCIISIPLKLQLFDFTKRLLIVLVIFYIIGVVIKIILDMNFKTMDDLDENEEEVIVQDEEDEIENIETSEDEEEE